MKSFLKILRPGFFLFIAFIILVSGCAASKQNPWMEKRKKASHVNTTQLGRNRYFFSESYQKKLQKSMKKR